jgi:hypothetical protein
MKKTIFFTLSIIALPTLLLSIQLPAGTEGPKYNASGELLPPENYREWVWLSSGLGMAYGPAARANATNNPPFDNVFVSPAAYRSFLQNGKWPDKTMFVLELRSSLDKGSINQNGRFQGNLIGFEVEVKDEGRFPGKWGFFEFRSSTNSAKQLPTTAECYACHASNGAVDNTFVQFYPTLIDVAKKHGTFIEK